MNIPSWLAVLGLLIIVGIRLVRWLAIVQQKEYRFDRLWLFLNSNEGVQELLRLIQLKDFSRTGFKRPRITTRIIATALGVASLSLLLAKVLSEQLKIFFDTPFFIWGITLSVLFFVLPWVVLIVALIPTFFVHWYAEWLLGKAAGKLKISQPLVIGITGSFGKTATKTLLAHVLTKKEAVFMPPKSHNTIISIAKSILNAYIGQKIVIIEYAAYKKGEIARLARRIQPEVAVITGLTEQHLGLFGSLEKIIEAKRELLAALPDEGTVYSANISANQIVTGSQLHNQKIVFIQEDESVSASLTERGNLIVQFAGKKITTHLVGLHYIDAVKTVVRIALDLGLQEQEIIHSLESFMPTTGFTKVVLLQNAATCIDDGGTSNPVGFKAVLNLAASIKAKRKILLTSGIVDLGEKSDKIHAELAKKANSVVDEVWYVGSVGREKFQEEFSEKCISDQNAILKKLAELVSTDLVVIEGRMPGWLLEKI